jgi:hypothetical protein
VRLIPRILDQDADLAEAAVPATAIGRRVSPDEATKLIRRLERAMPKQQERSVQAEH